ncbi:MAG: type IV secretion system protein [Acetobacter sp.]|nr:type IV secretion system protein [Acetobacter sp.]
MIKLRKYLFRYLPLIVGICFFFSASYAFAGIVDWAVGKAGETAAFILGIDGRDNCTPPQALTTCRFCPLFKILYNSGSYVAGKAYAIFSTDIGRVILTFLAVCLAIIVLKNLSSMNSKDSGTLLNDIFRKTFVCIAIFIIITQDYYNLMNITLIPVIKTGLDLASIGYPISSCSSAGGIQGFTSLAGANAEAGLPREIGEMIICTAENIESRINLLFENGEWAFCLGMGPHRLLHIIPHPVYLIDALFLYLGGIFFFVAYPWVLADAILQLGIAMALMPFAVAGYAFNGTKSYLGKVFGWILHSIFVFIFMAILMTCILDYIGNLLKAATAVVDPATLFTDANSGIAFFGPNMVMLIFILVIGWSYMPMTKELADSFSNGSGLSAAQSTGNKVTAMMEKQSGKIAEKTAGMMWDRGKSMGRSAMHIASRQGANAFVSAFGKTDATGNKELNLLGIKFTKVKNADGSTYLQRDFTSLTGRKHLMASDKYMTIKSESTGGTNTQVKNTVTFKKEFAEKYLFNADGSINKGSLDKLLSSPLAQNPEYKQAIMEQVAVQALKVRGKQIGTYYKSRNVTFDPNNPYNIVVEQFDNTGKKTTFSLNINQQTGQTAVSFMRTRDRNSIEQPVHDLNVGRKQAVRAEKIDNVVASAKLLNTLSFGLVKYTTSTDANGDAYYIRENKKFLFFGKKQKKIYTLSGTQKQVINHLGSQTIKTKNVDNPLSEEYEFYFDNGVVSVDTTGTRNSSTHQFGGEQTRIRYSEAAQAGHDTILGDNNSSQIVDENGNISARLQGDDNPLNLVYGMDNIAGITNIGGINMGDFIVNNLLAEGRRRKTNNLKTSLGGILP